MWTWSDRSGREPDGGAQYPDAVPELPNVPELLRTAVHALGGKERRNQLTMASAVAHSLDTGEHLAVHVRGAVLPRESRVLVVIGPHPPPPLASMNPPNRPSGDRNLAECGEVRACATAGGRTENRSAT